tara:strand:- start:417 stop:611 length:195 start_codon:yes stop_codon:yes gene_type:complete
VSEITAYFGLNFRHWRDKVLTSLPATNANIEKFSSIVGIDKALTPIDPVEPNIVKSFFNLPPKI